MSFGPIKVYETTIASNATSSSAISLAKAYGTIFLEIPTMTSGCQIYIQGSTDGSSFRRVMHPPYNTATAQSPDWAVASTTSQRMVQIPCQFPYMKVEVGTATTAVGGNAYTFKLICSDT